MSVLFWALRLGFGALFIVAGASKLLRARSIRHTVAAYRLLPAFAVPVVAALLAPMELAAGALLLASFRLPVYGVGWTLAAGLLLVFSVAVGSALARGIVVPCGCGRLLNGHVITGATLRRNLMLLLLLALDLFAERAPAMR